MVQAPRRCLDGSSPRQRHSGTHHGLRERRKKISLAVFSRSGPVMSSKEDVTGERTVLVKGCIGSPVTARAAFVPRPESGQ